MAIHSDTRGASLAFFGRFKDDLSRDVLRAGEYRVGIAGGPIQPMPTASYKGDGYFVFQNLRLSAPTYTVRFDSPLYQSRLFEHNLPTADPVELTFAAEDEIYVRIKSVAAGPRRVGFDLIPFLPRIARGAAVLGEGGFSTTLRADLEGVDVATAELTTVTGLAVDQLLRIVRSRSLLAKPGPYYPFPAGTTVLALRLVADAAPKAPVERATVQLQRVDSVAPLTTVVGGVALKHVTLPNPPGTRLILGPERELTTTTDARGRGVLYFPGEWPVTSVDLQITAPGYLPTTVHLALAAKQRTSATIELTRA